MGKAVRALAICLLILLPAFNSVMAQDEEAEIPAADESVTAEPAGPGEWPPKNSGTAIPMIFGPEGYGGGLGFVLWDFGAKDGRRLFVQPILADTDYRTYVLEYTEPSLLVENDQLDFTAFYQKRTGTHYFGVGPDPEIDDGAYYQRENYLVKLSYKLPLVQYFGITGEIGYDRTALGKSTLDDRPDFHDDHPELDRPIEDVYPELFDSRDFDDEFNHYWSVALWLDTREGPREFTTRGIHLAGRLDRVDENNGADWNYWRYTASAAAFFPVVDDYNVICGRLRWDRVDGKNVPFYKLPTLGQARYSLAHVTGQKAMRGIWENLLADKNRYIATVEYRHRTKGAWIPANWAQPISGVDFDLAEFVRNTAVVGWADVGQVWPDDLDYSDIITSFGISAMLYFDNGIAQQFSIGFSNDLSMYMSFSYGTQF